ADFAEDHRVGAACGGASLEPRAFAGVPGMNRLQPLFPETRSKKGCSSSSMHKPSVVFATAPSGSICHHLQSLHKPHLPSADCADMAGLLVITRCTAVRWYREASGVPIPRSQDDAGF